MEEQGLVYGRNPVEELLETSKRKINKILVAKGVKQDNKIKKIISSAKENSILLQEVPKEKLNTMVQGNHQGVIALVADIEYAELDDIRKKLSKKEEPQLIIMLDSIEDPHNLGAIIRTAEVAGADAIMIPKRRSASVTPLVEKVSTGAVEYIPIVRVTNLTDTIKKLKDDGFWIYGAEGSGYTHYFNTDYAEKTVLIFGGEGKGISQIVKKNCDELIKIPILGKINSLNVSNAASISIFEVVRQRILKKQINA